jgi:ParB-like chromosome segregation protein Spo0J
MSPSPPAASTGSSSDSSGSSGSSDSSGTHSASSARRGKHVVETKDFIKSEYVNLLPTLSNAEYGRLKQSINERGLLVPIIVNQDNVVLDGYHRLMACKELGIPIICSVIDFTDRFQDELEYVMAVNLHRRHLNESQRAEIGLKIKKKASRMAAERKQASQFTRESGREAIMKRFYGDRVGPPATNRISLGGRTCEELAKNVNVSPATIQRVDTILEEGSPEQIASLRNSKGPGIKTIYGYVQFGKLQRKNSSALSPALRKHNPKLLNKGFRIVTQDEIPDGSVDLVLVLKFPEVRMKKDEELIETGGRIYEQLMDCASRWLKNRGLLVMHVKQHFLPGVIRSCPPTLQFCHLLSVTGPGFRQQQKLRLGTIFAESSRPYCVYVKGQHDIEPRMPELPSFDIITIPDGPEFNEEGLAINLIRRISQPGASICDPFMGKGAVGRAVLKTGRAYIGIEEETAPFLLAKEDLSVYK